MDSNSNRRKQDPKLVATAMQKATQLFNQQEGPTGKDDAQADPLSEGARLTDQGQEKNEDDPKPNPALNGVTRNVQFAEALAGEQKDLAPNIRSFQRSTLGSSNDHVKVYTGRFADLAIHALGAEAFAIDKHIFIRSDKFKPGTAEGLGLLAHEVAHTLQGGRGGRKEKEEEAEGFQSKAMKMAENAGKDSSSVANEGGGGELALDQAPLTPGDVPKVAGSAPAQSTEGKTGQLSDHGQSVEESRLFEVLRVELFRKLRDEADIQSGLHGVGVFRR